LGVARRNTQLVGDQHFLPTANRWQDVEYQRERRSMTPAQCRAARGLIHMTTQALADAADVRATTVWDYEQEAVRTVLAAEIGAMRHALEKAGVEFIEGGVRMRKGK
jgi:hypothetical protein